MAKVFDNLWCASLIDFIQRKMTLLVYNRYDAKKQFALTIDLTNYNEILDMIANPDIPDLKC